jgi:PTS system nitrogen regulatory IIA component
MNILDFLVEDAINVKLVSGSKKEVLAELVEPLVKAGKVSDGKKMVEVLLEREELGSTGIGQRIAIPHGKSSVVKELSAAFGVSQQGVAYDSLDGEPVNLFFVLVAPEGSAGVHLKALARISGLLKDKFFKKALMQATSRADVIKVIESEEQSKA